MGSIIHCDKCKKKKLDALSEEWGSAWFLGGLRDDGSFPGRPDLCENCGKQLSQILRKFFKNSLEKKR